jgi:hypothetical protein
LVAVAAVPALAAEDPIAVRQALMASNGAAGAVAGAMLKDELAYNPLIAKSAIASLDATAQAIGDFFPEGTLDPARSEALPKIWEDPAGFTAALAKWKPRRRRPRPPVATVRRTRPRSARRWRRSSIPARAATRPIAPKTDRRWAA